MSVDAVTETTVNDRGGVQVPAEIRDQLDVESGDRIRWILDEDGVLSIEVIHQREDAFEDFEAVDIGPTDAATADDEFWQNQ